MVALLFGAALMQSVCANGFAQQPQPAPAAKPEAQGAPVRWLTQCGGAGQDLDCRVSLTIVVRQTGQRLLSVIVRRPSKSEGPGLMLHLPHGLFLPAATTVQIDKGKAQTLPVQTCDSQGCYAGAPIGKDMLTALQKGEQLVVSFQDLKKQLITVPVPLAGFGEAYQKLP